MSFLLIVSLIAVVSVGMLLMKIFSAVQPSDKQIDADIKAMKADLEPLTKDLLPISKEELELFSQSQINAALKKKGGISAKGVFTTIYHEPLVAYSYKRYPSAKLNAVLYARSADHEFVYRIKKGEIQLVVDLKHAGTLKDNGVLYDARNRPVASINRAHDKLLPVQVEDREVGNLLKPLPEAKKELSQRAFELVRPDLNDKEETLFLSLAVLELVNRSVEK
ncbi:MAG: hypothetical protein HUU01_07715 [Saprospiraceae bacterium]|nr:hypothetical protein [Saprospiraceae bacterium]